LNLEFVKAPVRALTRHAVAIGPLWRAICPLAERSNFIRAQRAFVEHQRFTNNCAGYFSAQTVMQGPFAGLKYPADLHHWTAPFAKLLGTYENELHAAFAKLSKNRYTGVVNIGFAEGFYLAGLARLFPHARLVGYDIDPAAHEICRQLAHLNGVSSERLRLAAAATPEHLRCTVTGQTLVICDCEGYEATLFTPETLSLWCDADLVIECHDFVRPETTATLARLFGSTHSVEIIASVDSETKIAQVPADARSRFTTGELRQLVNEGRPCAMTWIVAITRSRDRISALAGPR
jgi:hypothetical protein